MHRVLAVLVLVLALAGAGVPDAHAVGPFCFQLTPYSNVVVWFVDSSGGNQFAGSGRDLTQNASQSVTAFVSGSTAVVTFVTAAGSGATSIPYIGSAELNLNTNSGPGRFSNLRAEGISNTAITLVAVACPASALASAGPDPGRFPGIAAIPRPAPESPAGERAPGTSELAASHLPPPVR